MSRSRCDVTVAVLLLYYYYIIIIPIFACLACAVPESRDIPACLTGEISVRSP